ncbi:3-isopropylmalate dehydratase small subunit [candidate division WOR-3 bacterium]|uniref:3-isopropylmalate dehydratase small subunit n=1 Tax=candidate division WOR-3 bacterium TaxID=2052148 RepID=A0A660SH83_UNCW3|nr:MAG: 3-isopropylmalate dehydratase small subunit [candidate division WOR-3 bacterium]
MIRGKVLRLGDDIDTDQIYPGRYLPLTDEKEMARHALEGVRGCGKITEILVAGRNFGCGSSREHAPIALKGAGVRLIIAKSFGPIFYRNSINIGLPVVVFDPVEEIGDGDELEVDIKIGRLRNLTKNWEVGFSPLSGLELDIFTAGGLLNYLRRSGTSQNLSPS